MLHSNSETRENIYLVSIHETFEIFQHSWNRDKMSSERDIFISCGFQDWKADRSLRWLLFGYSVLGDTGKSRLENTQIPALLSLPDGRNLHEEGFSWLSKSEGAVWVLGQRLLAEVICSVPHFPVDKMQRGDGATRLAFSFSSFFQGSPICGITSPHDQHLR